MFNQHQIQIVCGPCSLESETQIQSFFQSFSTMRYLRAGIYKMRTSSKNFQGLREKGVEIIKSLRRHHSFQLISEVVSPESLEILDPVCDIFQVGSRNMYNYELLKELSKTGKPILLKRAFTATLQEFIYAAEYIENSKERVILCERGVRTFEKSYRNMMDINAIAYLKQQTPYTVFADPSHGTGVSELVSPLAYASIAAGADGLLIEAHPNPKESFSDAQQALSLGQLYQLIERIKDFSKILKKEVVY